ncbi:hypothetical protein [Rickettsia endosymbiont of Halotydeus destructor]|uniref:hypothetical protein n=1 Tax=Rickettsia endosymbiont of Halotydeus destructor TaxID=2996754 RepID=UPI003BB1EFDF
MNEEEEKLLNTLEEDEYTEEEKRQKAEDSRKQLKAILFTFFPLLIGFLVFTYYFLNSIEEKAQVQRRLEIREAMKLERQNKAQQNQQVTQPLQNPQTQQ